MFSKNHVQNLNAPPLPSTKKKNRPVGIYRWDLIRRLKGLSLAEVLLKKQTDAEKPTDTTYRRLLSQFTLW
jgi:hypothetical protein